MASQWDTGYSWGLTTKYLNRAYTITRWLSAFSFTWSHDPDNKVWGQMISTIIYPLLFPSICHVLTDHMSLHHYKQYTYGENMVLWDRSWQNWLLKRGFEFEFLVLIPIKPLAALSLIFYAHKLYEILIIASYILRPFVILTENLTKNGLRRKGLHCSHNWKVHR